MANSQGVSHARIDNFGGKLPGRTPGELATAHSNESVKSEARAAKTDQKRILALLAQSPQTEKQPGSKPHLHQ